MGSEGVRPRILKAPDDINTKPLLMIFQQSCCWRTKDPSWLKAGKCYPGFQEEQGKPWKPQACHLSLASVPGKLMENIILRGIEKHLKDNGIIGHRQHGRGKKKEGVVHWLLYTAEKIVAIHLLKYPWSIVNAIFSTTYQVLDILRLIILIIPKKINK